MQRLRMRCPQEAAEAEQALVIARDAAALRAQERRHGGAAHTSMPPPPLPPPLDLGSGEAPPLPPLDLPPLPPGEPEPRFVPVLLRRPDGGSVWRLATASLHMADLPPAVDYWAGKQQVQQLIEFAGAPFTGGWSGIGGGGGFAAVSSRCCVGLRGVLEQPHMALGSSTACMHAQVQQLTAPAPPV